MTPPYPHTGIERDRTSKESAETTRKCEPPDFNWPRLEMNSSRHDWVELSLPCSFQAVERFDEFTASFFYELPENTREELRTALRELILNAIEWGGRLDETRRVRVTIVRGRDSIFCKVADPGDGFSFHNLSHASICNAADKPWDHLPAREKLGLRAGGFGLAIVEAAVDELIFNETGNEVVFIKNLKQRRPSAQASHG
jgi:anti-sigma regulatory factor (Ser/Thr protein kinase)